MALWGGVSQNCVGTIWALVLSMCPPHLWDIMLTRHHPKLSKKVNGFWWNTELGFFIHPSMDKPVSPLEQRVAKLLTRSVYPSIHDAHPGTQKMSMFGPGKTQFLGGNPSSAYPAAPAKAERCSCAKWGSFLWSHTSLSPRLPRLDRLPSKPSGAVQHRRTVAQFVCIRFGDESLKLTFKHATSLTITTDHQSDWLDSWLVVQPLWKICLSTYQLSQILEKKRVKNSKPPSRRIRHQVSTIPMMNHRHAG